jgi:2,4-dienoyl-CoA reductase-like NADH-dependent reductase (Old Yellow Enzyme family)
MSRHLKCERCLARNEVSRVEIPESLSRIQVTHMTTEALTIVEQDAALASGPMLNHYVELVRKGIQDVSQDVREHGEALLIKLAHLVRQQRAEPVSPAQEYLAPWISLAEPERAAA